MKRKQKSWYKRITALLLALVMVVGSSAVTYGESGWAENNGKWYFFYDDGSFVKNNVKKSGVKWFWLDDNGTLILNQAGKKVTDGQLIYTLRDDGSVEDIVYDKDGISFDVDDLKWDWGLTDDGQLDGETFYRAGWYAVDRDGENGSDAWVYCDRVEDENGNIKYEPRKNRVSEIDGLYYYMDENGYIKWEDRGTIVKNKYFQMRDYSVAVNRWIPINGKWSYFNENGKMVKEKAVIDGVEYDFGITGYVERENLGSVKSITLYPETEVAYVGDTVEIPFEIAMQKKEKIWVPDEDIASPSDAEEATPSEGSKGHWEEKVTDIDTDYSIFKNTYAVSHTYRVNMGVYETKHVEGNSCLKYAIETNFDIDWDKQVIRFPIENNGAVFGDLQIDGKFSNDFGIICKFREDIAPEDKIDSVLNQDYPDQNGVVTALKNTDTEELSGVLRDSADIRMKISALEAAIRSQYNIQSKTEISPEVQEYFPENDVTVVGLTLSAKDKKNAELVFKIDKSNETLPDDMGDYAAEAAFDMTASGGNISASALDVPVYIRIPLPKGFTGNNLHLFHLHNGEIEELEVTVEDGKVGFVTTGFSSFIFTEEKENSGGTTGGTTGGTSGETSGGGSGSGTSRKMASSAQNIRPETPGSWLQDAAGWKLLNASGLAYVNTWAYKGGQWYWLGEDGYMKTGWNVISGKWYYLMPVSGEMKTGWIADGGNWYYTDETGARAVGWVKSGEKWYYLNDDGKMAANTTTPDGYKVDENGARVG